MTNDPIGHIRVEIPRHMRAHEVDELLDSVTEIALAFGARADLDFPPPTRRRKGRW